MVKIARGLDDETLEREPSLFTVINSSSPLRLDTPMLEGDHPDGAPQPGGGADAVHACRRDGAGHARRRARAAARRGAGGPRHDPGRAAGRAVRLWRIHLERGHEVGRAGLRHARIYEDGDRRRAAGAPPRPALSLLERQRRQFARRPGGLRERVLALGRDHGRRQLSHAWRGLDGGRVASLVREDGARRRSFGDGRRVPAAAARRRGGAGARGDARSRPRRAFLRRRAHPVALSHRLFLADHLRLAQLRDLARSRLADRARRGRAHRRRPPARFRRRRRSRPNASRRSTAFVARRKAEGGAPTDF